MRFEAGQTMIERGFELWTAWVIRHAWLVLAISTVTTLYLTTGIAQIKTEFSGDSYLLSTDPALQVYHDFRDQFGMDSVILVVVDPPEVFDLAFLKKLRLLHRALEDQVPHLDEIDSLVNARHTRDEDGVLIAEELMGHWEGTPEDLEIFRQRALSNPLYRNTLISEDGSLVVLVLKPATYSARSPGREGTDAGFGEFDDGAFEGAAAEPIYLQDDEQFEMVRAIEEVTSVYEDSDFQIFLAGEPVVGERMVDITWVEMPTFVFLAILIIAGLLLAIFGRLQAALLPIGIVAGSVLSTFGLVGLLGIPFTMIMQVLPCFFVAVGVCGAVHILSSFFQEVRLGRDKNEAIIYAMGHSGLAVLMTTLTTAGGLGAFATAKLAPVAMLGVVAPMGVIIAMVYTFTALPAALVLLPLRPPPARGSGRTLALVEKLEDFLVGVGDFATSHARSVLWVTLLLVLVGASGIAQLRFGHDTLRWLMPDDPVRMAVEHMDDTLGGIADVELLVDTGRENGLYEPETLQRLDAAMDYAKSVQGGLVQISRATSIVDIIKETHQSLNEEDPAFYVVPESRDLVAQELLLFENSGSDDLIQFTDSSFQTARISMAVNNADALHYVPFLEKMRLGIGEQLGPELNFEFTGGVVLFSRAFSVLLDSMMRSYIVALIVITPLMMLLMGSVRLGLISMLPNLLPVYLILAIMGWFDIPLSMSTLLIGGIVIGVAVDDTIHFMHQFGREYQRTGDVTKSVHETLSRTGLAILSTSIALIGSFGVYNFGAITGIRQMGYLVDIAIAIALIADLVLAPALLVVTAKFLYPSKTGESSK